MLPPETQKLARHNYSLLKKNPSHPSLHFKQVCHGSYRSVRVGLHYRAIGVPVPDSGSGSEHMLSMTNYWANAAKVPEARDSQRWFLFVFINNKLSNIFNLKMASFYCSKTCITYCFSINVVKF